MSSCVSTMSIFCMCVFRHSKKCNQLSACVCVSVWVRLGEAQVSERIYQCARCHRRRSAAHSAIPLLVELARRALGTSQQCRGARRSAQSGLVRAVSFICFFFSNNGNIAYKQHAIKRVIYKTTYLRNCCALCMATCRIHCSRFFSNCASIDGALPADWSACTHVGS